MEWSLHVRNVQKGPTKTRWTISQTASDARNASGIVDVRQLSFPFTAFLINLTILYFAALICAHFSLFKSLWQLMQWRLHHVRPKTTQFVDVSMGTARDSSIALHGIVSPLRGWHTNKHLQHTFIQSENDSIDQYSINQKSSLGLLICLCLCSV